MNPSVDEVIVVEPQPQSRSDLLENGFTRRPLAIDIDVAHALADLAHAAWSIERDRYYDAGDRYRSLNRFRAEILGHGVRIQPGDDATPYLQQAKYNTTLGGRERHYSPLPAPIADSCGVRKLIAHHLHYLPMSRPGLWYTVNMHILRFAATPGRPCDTSPPGLHKDGEKYLATHLLARCGAQGGAVVITDNDRRELDRFTLREGGECYVFDDDRIWHMLTPVAVLDGNRFAYRDTLAFDMIPDGWEPPA